MLLFHFGNFGVPEKLLLANKEHAGTRHALTVAYAPPITGGRTQPPHPARR